ncbi:alpha/beta hydrolase-fold protein [Prolixibacteraceae bacterium]|nr:alpha/beta hydrolase-fold protein [Prolixibacteraceae bacterium]
MRYLFFLSFVMLFFSCIPNNKMRIDMIHPYPSSYIEDRNVDIWLPQNYSKDKRYQVLYMHDGQMLHDSTSTWNQQAWMAGPIMQKLISNREVPETIIVGIWNIQDHRTSDYWPAKPFNMLPKSLRNSLIEKRLKRAPNSDKYLKFIVEELKPYIDRTYATYTDQKHTFIAGSSMGGLISMYAICEYPKIFSGAACLSTHWIGGDDTNNAIAKSFINYIDQYIPSAKNHKFYFDHGTETLDQHYGPSQLKVNAVFIKHGYTKTNFKSEVFVGDKHEEKYWAQRLHIPFKFILNR